MFVQKDEETEEEYVKLVVQHLLQTTNIHKKMSLQALSERGKKFMTF
jgi:hypothetical protein